MINPHEPRDIVSEFCAALSAGDARGALGLLAPDATWWVGGSVQGLSGTKAGQDVKDMVGGVLALTTDGALRIEPRAWTVDGGRVALEARVMANLRSGSAYDNDYHFMFEVESGLIVRVRAYLDTEHLRDVFGSSTLF